MERLKRYDITGIVDPDKSVAGKSDMHDRRVTELYKKVTEEMLDRLKKIES
jgi:hypothetical protein